MSDQYFASQPTSEARERPIVVSLNGNEYTLTTAAGIFSPDHIDVGTQVLLDSAPEPTATGSLLDIGCGWGPIALTLALSAPAATVYAIDVNERALDLTRRNAIALGRPNVHPMLPDQVAPDVRFDTIWSNPPIRIGKPALHALLETWLPRLADNGDAWLVVQKNLGADSLLTWLNDRFAGELTASREITKKGFRVLRVARIGAVNRS